MFMIANNAEYKTFIEEAEKVKEISKITPTTNRHDWSSYSEGD